MKKFLLNADNFGKSLDYNRAVLNGYNNGFIKSAGLIANGSAFDTALNEIIPECQHLSVGLHVNLTEGFPISKAVALVDNTGEFDTSFCKLRKMAKKSVYIKEIEQEIRAQIEKVKSQVKIDYISSVDNVHCIPEIFEVVCKLAEEFQIPFIRTCYEEFYVVPKLKYIIHPRFLYNIFTNIKLSSYTKINKKTLKQYETLKTNDFIIGNLYSGLMDKDTIESGLKTLKDEEDIIVECVIQPCSYLSDKNDFHSKEFKLTQDKILEDSIYRMGFEITNHKI